MATTRLLTALSLSASLAPLRGAGMRARVHSVFERTANLHIEAGMSAGLSLITIARDDVGNLPGGLLVRSERELRLNDALAKGDDVRFLGGRLYTREMIVDLMSATLWDPEVTTLAAEPWVEDWRRRWETALDSTAEWLLERRPTLSGEPGGARAAGHTLACLDQRLAEALERGDRSAAEDYAATLVGLGPGLTPAGDDYLVGLLAALYAQPNVRPRHGLVQSLANRIRAAMPRTTDISRAYLGWALDGQVTERVKGLLTSIVRAGPPGSVRAATRAALAVGASSGLAGVKGLLRGLSVWNDYPVAVTERLHEMDA